MEGHPLAIVSHVHLCTAVNQQLACLFMPFACAEKKRRLFVIISCVDKGTSIHQQLAYFAVAAFCC
jgi:hypothetical protein